MEKTINGLGNSQLHNARCSECGLLKICLPGCLNPDELQLFDEIVSCNLKFQAEETLYRQGDAFSGFYAIKSGATKSSIVSENGSLQIVGFQFPGYILGLDAYNHQTNTTSVFFLENSIVCEIPYAALNLLCNKIPPLHLELMLHASREISHDHELLMTDNQKTAEERLAFFLIEMLSSLNQAGQTSTTQFQLPMQRKDIGNYLGLSQETVSRIFAKFERDGMIVVSGKNVRIVNQYQLEKLGSICNCFKFDPPLKTNY